MPPRGLDDRVQMQAACDWLWSAGHALEPSGLCQLVWPQVQAQLVLPLSEVSPALLPPHTQQRVSGLLCHPSPTSPGKAQPLFQRLCLLYLGSCLQPTLAALLCSRLQQVWRKERTAGPKLQKGLKGEAPGESTVTSQACPPHGSRKEAGWLRSSLAPQKTGSL